MNSVNSK